MYTLTRALSVSFAVLFLAGCPNEDPRVGRDNRTNVGPEITSVAPTAATEDLLWQYQLEVNDPDDRNDGRGLRYRLITAPSGMSVSRTGLISWTPPNGVLSAPVVVAVGDGGENGAVPDSQSFTIHVTPVNDAPVIYSVPRTSAVTATPYSYQLLVSDPDDANNGTSLTYQLLNAPAGMTVSATGLVQWTPAIAGVSADVEIEVRDGGEDGAAPATQSWSINVVAGNSAPMITSSPVTAATEGAAYSYQLAVSDAEDANNGADLTFSLLNAPAGMTVSATGLLEWTPGENGAAPWVASVEVQVADGGEDGVGPDTQAFDINVTPVNNAPSITSVAPTSASEGVLYSYAVQVADSDDANNGTDISFSLVSAPAGMTVSSTGVISWTPGVGVTSADVQLAVMDGGEDLAAPATQSWTITIDNANDAPTITSVPFTDAVEGVAYEYQLVVSDPDDANNGVDLTFSLLTAPAGMTVSSTGLITWTPGEGGAADWSENVEVQVADGGEDGALPATQSFTIDVTPVNNVPAFVEADPQAIVMSEDGAPAPFALTLNVTDSDNTGDEISWSISTAAANGTASASGTGLSKVIGYVPAANFSGDDSFVVQVDDGDLQATLVVNVTVTAVNDAPAITSVAPTAASEDTLYQYAVQVADADDANNGTDLVFSLPTAPAGMTISSTGLIQWTPAFGTTSANVTVQVADGGEDGVSPASQSWVITVSDVNQPPVITEGDSVSVTMSEDGSPVPFALTLNATDPDAGASLTWSLDTVASNGVASAAGTGNALVVGYTPAANFAGTDSFVVAVSDGTFTDTITVNVTINAINDAPVITSAALTSATEDQLYQYSVLANDVDGPSATWSLTTAPAGMTISAAGVISWTPGEGGAAPWTADVTVQVSDGALADSQSFTINVTPVNDAPTITSTASTSATEGALYSYQVVVSDSDDSNNGTDISFSLTTAPAGMTVSPTGLIQWTPPNGVSSADVTVQVADGGENGAAVATQSWTITVGATNDAPTITSAAVTAATEGTLYNYQLTVDDADDANNGTDLSWSLTTAPAGMTISSTGLIAWTPGENGATPWTADVTVRVADGGENGALPDTQSFTINVTPVNNAPTIDQGDSVAVTMSEDGTPTAFAVVISASDADTAAGSLTWSLGGVATNGTATASGTGASPTVTYTPNADFVGSDSFVVSVSDGEFSDSITVNVTVGAENDAPTIVSSAVTTATEDALYQYAASAADPDGPSLSWSLTGAPAGMTVSAAGLVQWVPGEGGVAPWTADVTLQVSDGSLTDSQSFTINVTPVNDAPSITSVAPTSATEGNPYSYQLVVADPDDANNGTDIAFSLTTAPAGMTVSATGLIEWTPPNGVSSADVTVQIADGGEDGAAAATQSWTITVGDVNDAPTINSAAVTTATEGVAYSYQVTANDPDDTNNGTDLTWSLTTSPAGMTISSTGLINWTPGENGAAPWTADVTVQVADGGENGALPDTQSFTINVTPANNAPTIDQGDSVAVTMSEDGTPTAFAVAISASDADTAAGSLTWSLGGAAANGTATASGSGASPTVTYAPNADFVGSDSFIVSVSDGEFSDSITVNVTVEAQNDAPVITSEAITAATEDSAYSYDVDITDIDGPAPTFSLSVAPAGMTINPASGVISWTPGEGGAALWTADVTVDVTDGSLTDSQSFTINVTPVNDAPTITSSASTSATEGALYSYQVVVSDSDDSNNGTDISFSLTTAPAGMTVSATGLVEWTPPNGVTSADVTVQVADGGENSAAPATQSWTISVGDVNDAPTINSAAVTTATEGVAYSYQVTANDPDDANNGTDLSWSLTTAPAGMTISSTGLIAWTPGENGAAPWTADVTVQVADGGENGALPDTQSFTINVTPVNNAPTIDQGDSVAVTMSEDGTPTAFAVVISASDADTAAGSLSWSLGGAATNGTATASGSGASPTVTYMPNADFVGSDSFVVSVNDGELSDSITVNVTVEAQNDAPVITSAAITTATEDAFYQYDVNITDADGPAPTFSLSVAPAGMTINPASGVISWTPGEGGAVPWTADVTVDVTDGSLGDSQSFTINVTPVNDAPTITSSASTSATEGALYSYQVVVSDSDDSNNGTDISFSLTAAPAGMTVSSTGLIEWTPPNGVTSADVTVQVADGGENGVAAATQSWTITVGATNDAPVITSTAITAATEGSLYGYQLTVDDADDNNNGTDLTWSLTTAPTGMTISSTGLIQWTPGENGAAPWTADVTVQVADGGENGALPDTQSFTINVTPVNNAPTIDQGDSVAVTMSEDGTPTAFAVAISASDADTAAGSLTWSLGGAATNGTATASGSGASPTVTYTPNTDFVGGDSFVVSVSDGEFSDSITVNVTVEAQNDAPVITSAAITTATEDSAYSYDVDITDIDGPAPTFSLSVAPAGMTINPASGVIAWTPGEGGAAPWTADVTVDVTDGSLGDSQSFTINVTPVNDAPTVTSVAPTSATEGNPYSYQLVVADPDDANNGTDITFSLTTAPAGMTVSATGLIEWTPPNGVTSADVTVQVADGGENGATAATQSWTITVGATNDAPTITSAAVTAATEGVAYSYQVTANDPDDTNNGTDLSWSLTTAPAGMTISSTGLIAWTPGENGAAPWTADVTVQVADGGENGALPDTQSFTINVTPVNNAPTIDQGDSVAVTMSEDGTPTAFAVVISASDADTAAGSLIWSLGGAATNGTATASGSGASPTVTYAPNADFVGSDSFVVSVSDGEFSDSITVNVTVEAQNDAPVITSAAITTATEDALYQYDADVTDTDGPSATWTLTTAPAGMVIDPSSGVISWTPGENGVAPWNANVTVQVSDGSLTDSQSFIISVTPVNDAPLISSSPSTSATEGDLYSYQLVVADPDDSNNGTDISFSLTTAPAGMTVSATGLIEWTPPNGVSSADITVQVADGGENGAAPATQSWTITVGATNDAPTITSVAPTTATEDVLYSYQLVISDADDSNNGTDITFSLTTAPAGMTVSATGLIEWTPPNGVTSADVTVEAADGGEDGAAPAVQSWTIAVTATNDAPEITEGDAVAVTLSEDGSPTAFALTLNATDIDGDTLTWSIASAASNGVAAASGTGSSKAISYAPNADFNGSDSFVVSVSDGTVSDTITVNVTVEAQNDAPSITSSAVTTATEAVLYQYQMTVSDVDGPSATWSLTTAPAGMTISAAGLIQWTPEENGAADWTADVTAQVSDGTDTDTQSFTIAVTAVNNAPVITEGASIGVTMSEDATPTAFALTLNVTDADTAAGSLIWSISSAASNGTATATGTGLSKVIGYTPDADFSGADSFEVTVSDGALSDTITVNVTVEAQNDAPVISSAAVTTATEDSAYSYDVDVTDIDGPSATFSLTTAPAGMTIDPSSGVISWTPGEGGAAPWSEAVTVEVTDGTDTDSQSFTIDVTPVNDAPSITSAAPTSGVEGGLYSYAVAVSDSDDANNGTDLSWSLTAAPAGMTISSTGLIEWTPPNGVTSADVTVQVADGGENGAAPATQSWTIAVGATNDAPTITSVAPTSATEDAPYTYQLTVNDPDDANNGTDLAWSLTTAPAGMTISSTGLINWTPGEGGATPWTADVTVQVADGGENGALPDTQSFTINVTPVNDAPVIDQGASVAVAMSEDGVPTAFSVAISATDADTATGSLSWSLGSAATHGTATATGTGVSPTVTYAPNANFSGSDSFVVTVSDGEFSDSITVNVTIAAENDAPQITSAAVTSATEDVLYQYAAVVNDIDGPSATWSLTTAPAGMTVSAAGLVQWTPPENGTAPWTADVTLQVSDGTLTDTQSFTISVTPVNDAPSITSVAPTTATEDALYSYQLVISDVDDSNNGTDISFSLTAAPAGMTVSSTGLIEWTPANGVTSADVTVQAADGGENGAAAATQSWTITVTAVNDAPSITSVAPTSATEAVLYSYQLVISDADDSNNGTDISFSLTTAPAGMTVSSTGLIEWTPPNGVTSADVTVQAADGGEDGAAPAVQSWTISVAAVNDAPVITEGASVGVTMSEDGAPTPFSLTLNATDADGDTLFWSIQSAASNGTAGATGSGNSKAITYTPAANFSGSDSFVVRVSDSELFDDITVNVTVEAVNDAPVITSSAVTTATEDAAYSYDVDATDSDGPSLTFSLTTAPAGMTINPTTGVISWTPGEGGATPWNANVTVEVTDGTASDSQSFVISVTPVNDAPVITEGTSVSVTMSQNSAPTPFSLTLNATDVDSATLTWSIVTPAGNGAATASGTGASKAISYTPNLDYSGSDSFVVRVSDGALSDDIIVNVTIEQVNTPPSISSTPITEGYEGIPYQYDVEATDADGGTLTYSLTTAPAGMTINSSTGLIDWLPGDNGGTNDWDADVVVSVSDGTEAVTQSFTINVEVDRAVHGRGVKGVLSNALVEASLYDAGTDTWTLLATTSTNAAGVWGFDLPTQSVPVRIRLTTTASTLMVCDAPTGCGVAAFGETFSPEVDITLDTIVPGSQFSGPIAVTPLTNMTAQWIDDMPGGVNDDVILLAQRRVATLFGLNEAFTYSRAIDITRPIEVSTALASDSNRVRHALFAASVQELAAVQAITIASANQGLAQMFSLLGGQLLLQTGTIDLTEYGLDPTDPTVQYNGLDLMVTSAQTVGAQVNVGGALDAMLTSFDTLVSTWGGRVLSALGEGTGYNAANFARALAPLDEFDYYYGLAEAAEAGIDETNRSVGWMYIDETAQTNTTGMINTFSEALGLGFSAALCVPGLRQLIPVDCTDPGDVNDPAQSYSDLFRHKSGCNIFGTNCSVDHYDLELTGTRNGQTVNMVVHNVPDIRYLLGGTGNGGSGYPNDNGITLCYNGTISNSTAVMTISDFCLNPNLSNNDTSTFEGMSATDYTNETTLNAALDDLIADIYIYMRAYGDIDITSTNPSIGTYSMQNFDGNFTFNRRQITQPANPCQYVNAGYPCSMITVNGVSLNRTNPAGETLSSISGTDMFNLVLDDTSTLHIANDSDDLGLPVLRSITDVTITGLAPLNDVISEYLLSMIDATVPEPVVDWDQLQLDLADAVPSGTSTMQIFDTTNKLYTFTLNADGTVDVSQVNSLANAMTIDLKGVAGYVYADETLVSTGHLGNDEDGLLLSLVNDTQRSYVNANPSATAQLDGLIALIQQLFPPAEEPAP